jgi:hypothetical protein
MLFGRTSMTALSRFWAHVDSCAVCSPDGACSECKALLQAVTAEARTNAGRAKENSLMRTDAENAADSLREVGDADLMRDYEEVCRTSGGNEVRREALLVEITRRAQSLRFD